MKLNENDLSQILRKPGYSLAGGTGKKDPAPAAPAAAAEVKARAAAEDPLAGMNKTEARYLQDKILPRVAAGEIRRWRFDEVRFELAPLCWYKPDFWLVMADGTIELHEVKGAWIEEDAKIKYRVAAAKYPELCWKLWQWKDNAWRMLIGEKDGPSE